MESQSAKTISQLMEKDISLIETCRIFNITGKNITLINIIFINAYTTNDGGAITSNDIINIISCKIKFTDLNYNTASKTVKIRVNKEKTKIIAKTRNSKKTEKTKKYTITLKNSKRKSS